MYLPRFGQTERQPTTSSENSGSRNGFVNLAVVNSVIKTVYLLSQPHAVL